MAHACYWIVGINNTAQRPALAVDLHNDDGSLLCETMTFELASVDEAQLKAKQYADSKGITEIVFDPDSTDFFANC